MIKEDRHVMSHRPYAVDLSTYTTHADPGYSGGRTTQLLRAVWFRRKQGTLVAYYGQLWDISDATSAEEMLAKYTDGRYGGSWAMGYDGETVRLESPLTASAYQELSGVLAEALARFTETGQPPVGFDGWWVFE